MALFDKTINHAKDSLAEVSARQSITPANVWPMW